MVHVYYYACIYIYIYLLCEQAFYARHRQAHKQFMTCLGKKSTLYAKFYVLHYNLFVLWMFYLIIAIWCVFCDQLLYEEKRLDHKVLL